MISFTIATGINYMVSKKWVFYVIDKHTQITELIVFLCNLSFGPAMARALRRRYPDAFIDAHLMVDRLDVLLPLFVDAEVSLITVHAETEPQLLPWMHKITKN